MHIFQPQTARLLGSKATYTDNLRVSGFSHSIYVLELLILVPPLVPIVPIVVLMVALFGVWIGAAEVNQLRGWRSVALPLLALVVMVVGGFLIQTLLGGAEFTLQALLRDVGLIR